MTCIWLTRIPGDTDPSTRSLVPVRTGIRKKINNRYQLFAQSLNSMDVHFVTGRHGPYILYHAILSFYNIYMYIYRYTGRERERERESMFVLRL